MEKDELWKAYCDETDSHWLNDHEGVREAMESSYGYQLYALSKSIDGLSKSVLDVVEDIPVIRMVFK